MYRLIKRNAVAELECASDLIARQYAQADRDVERVETEAGRIVYRRTKESAMPDIDLSTFNNGDSD